MTDERKEELGRINYEGFRRGADWGGQSWEEVQEDFRAGWIAGAVAVAEARGDQVSDTNEHGTYHAETLGQLKQAVEFFIERHGEDTRVGASDGSYLESVTMDVVSVSGASFVVSDKSGKGLVKVVRIE